MSRIVCCWSPLFLSPDVRHLARTWPRVVIAAPLELRGLADVHAVRASPDRRKRYTPDPGGSDGKVSPSAVSFTAPTSRHWKATETCNGLQPRDWLRAVYERRLGYRGVSSLLPVEGVAARAARVAARSKRKFGTAPRKSAAVFS